MRAWLATGFVCAALCAPAALCEQFVALDLTATPDQLVPFDTDNPAAADPTHPTAVIEGTFIRGIAMERIDAGWFIQTSNSLGGTAGLWRVDAGVPTLIAPQPFTNSSDVGGLTFSRGATHLWGVIDPPTANDSLYRIDFDGTYTEIGEITIDQYGTSIRISGLALNPANGMLYALDALTDSLYEIDPTTASGTVVGDLGQNLDNLTGGLSFTADGSRLFAANNHIGNSTVHELDPTTGAIVNSYGDLPFSCSAISSLIPEPATLALLALAGLLIGRRRG
jgi:DNA-binding beta-propeller fold protein YncE